MNLPTAQRYAGKIVEWLAPHCERIEIAGSIRRGLPNCNDVDIVCIPKLEETRGLAGPTGQRNLLWEFLYNYVADGRAKFQSGGNAPGKFAILQLAKCQLDVFFATPETFASRFLCRTGSKEHNIWLATRAQERGGKWEPYEGLIMPRLESPLPGAPTSLTRIPTQTEAEIYALLGLEFIQPKNREAAWIKKNLEFGL